MSDSPNPPADFVVDLLPFLGCGQGRQIAELSFKNPPMSKGASYPSAMLFSLFRDLFFKNLGIAMANTTREELGRVFSLPSALLHYLFPSIWQHRQLQWSI